MKITILKLALFLLLAQLLPAQITPVTVSPEPLTGFNRSPQKMVQVGSRLVAIFGYYNDPLMFSDDNGATWSPTSVFSGQLYDIAVKDDRLFVLTYISGNSTTEFIVWQSDDLGATFTKSYTAVDPIEYDNSGEILGHALSGKLSVVNGHIFLMYKWIDEGSGSPFKQYFRGNYSADNGNTWLSFNPFLEQLPAAYNIHYFKNRYTIALDGYGPQVTFAALTSETPDFNDFTPLEVSGLFPGLIHGTGVADDKLFIIADWGHLYTIEASDGSEDFTHIPTPFFIMSADVINNQLYYVSYNGILRADPADPIAPQLVLNSPFNGNAKGGGPHPFSSAGGMITLESGVPVKSTDNGLTWSEWKFQETYRWSGYLYATDNQLFADNGWGCVSGNGTQFDLWKPGGVSEPNYQPWQTVFSHKGRLFYANTNENAFNPATVRVTRSNDQGQNWSVVDTRDNVYRSILYGSKQRLYWNVSINLPGAASTGELKYSDDAGNTWNAIPTEAPSIITGMVASGDSIFCLLYKHLVYSYDLGQTWDSTAITPGYYHIYYHAGKIALCSKSSGVISTSTDGGKTFVQTINLPNGVGKYARLIADSVLVASNSQNGLTYAGKIGSTKWISFAGSADWSKMNSMAYFGGYLYGSRGNYNSLTATAGSTFSRIPFDQILDPLNAMPDDAGVVSGRLFIDLNNNCTVNTNEKTLSGQIVSIEPGGYTTATNPSGGFSIALPPGNYTVSTDTPLYHLPACFGPNFNVAVTTAQNVAKNIAFNPNGTVQDLAVTVVNTPLRPGRNTHFTIEIKNHGTVASPAGVALKFNFPENPMFYVGSFPAGASVNQGEVQFLMPSIPAYSSLKFHVTLDAAPDPTLTGQTLSFTAEAVDNFGDAFPADNLYSLPVIVTNSFDPNDKTAFTNAPKGDKITPDDPSMKFLIRFQNTGTDTAFQIIIRDTLSPLLDVKTIKTLSTSHDYRFVLRDNNIAEWHFNPMALPDSTRNEAASHGFVLFSIDGKVPLPFGKSIDNRAGIFFDFNPAVLTNTTHTKVVRRIIYRDDAADAAETAIRVLPNPATSYFTIELDEAKSTERIFELFNPEGKKVVGQSFTGSRLQVLRNQLPAGIYQWVVRQNDSVTGSGNIILK